MRLRVLRLQTFKLTPHVGRHLCDGELPLGDRGQVRVAARAVGGDLGWARGVRRAARPAGIGRRRRWARAVCALRAPSGRRKVGRPLVSSPRPPLPLGA